MKWFTIMLFTMFTFLTVNVHAMKVLNQTAKVGSASDVKCADGLKCSVIKGVMNLNAYHAASSTWASGDATPSVDGGTWFETYAATSPTQTVTFFDDGVAGKEIKVVSKGNITFDVTGTHLKCGSTDLATAAGDVSSWLFDGVDWLCTSFVDASDNLN